MSAARDADTELHEREILGGIAAPAFIGIAYGVVQLFRHGAGPHAFPFTFLPILGGVAALAATVVHTNTLKAPDGPRWALTAGALALLIPYLFSLYLAGFLGAWATFRAVTAHPLAWGHVLVGVFWIIIGWRMLFMLGHIKRPWPPATA